MTSQQDTELPHMLDDFAEELKEIRATAKEDYYYETHGMSDDIDEAYEKAIQALTSWKDKEVQKAKLRLINTEIRKLQKNEVWYRFDDCVWELKQTRKRITKSLQSQGGKMVQIKERKGE